MTKDGSLYVIVERTSKTRFSNFIPAANDIVAVFGFTDFIRKLDDHTKPECYALYKVGDTYSDGQIGNVTREHIVNGDKAEELYGDMLSKALEEEKE